MFEITSSVIAALPLVAIVVTITLLLLIDLFLAEKPRGLYTGIGVAGCVLAWALSVSYWFGPEHAFRGQFIADPLTFVFYSILLGGTALALLLNSRQLEAQGVRNTVDVDLLILIATFGGMVMVSASHLIVLFLGFEILSVAVYVLAGAAREEKASSEGALKYFLLGAFSSAFLLYGMVLVFGATGSMQFDLIRAFSAGAGGSNPLLIAGFALILFGFAFKIGLVPFHFWAPDTYQGSPVSITTYMAAVVKAAAFGSLLRLLGGTFAPLVTEWIGAVALLSGLTMTVGNLLALRQKSVKRMLAYSSIAHAGYILMGLVAGRSGGFEAAIFYIAIYSLMTFASFGVVLLVTAGTKEQYLNDTIESYRGLGWRYPVLGLAMTIALLSLAGIPPLAGFFAKFYLFVAVVKSGFLGLAVLAALNSVVSLYYYLSVLVAMYFDEKPAVERGDKIQFPFGSQVAVSVSVALILVAGVFSQPAIEISKRAVQGIVTLTPQYTVGVYESRGTALRPFTKR